MPSIEELKTEKERLQLEAEVTRLRKQKDRREAVEEFARPGGWEDLVKLVFWLCAAGFAVFMIAMLVALGQVRHWW